MSRHTGQQNVLLRNCPRLLSGAREFTPGRKSGQMETEPHLGALMCLRQHPSVRGAAPGEEAKTNQDARGGVVVCVRTDARSFRRRIARPGLGPAACLVKWSHQVSHS